MGAGASHEPEGASAAVVRREAQPAEVFDGVVPWLRPLAYAGWFAFIMLGPFPIAAIAPRLAIAVPAILVAMLAASLAVWRVARGQLIPAHIEVGTDGVSVAWMGLRRFYPFEGMDVAVPVGGCAEGEVYNNLPTEAVRLTYQDGRTVKLGVTRQDHASLANGINRRLDEYQAGDRAAPRASAVAALQCSDQRSEDWLAALRRQPVDGYRTDLTRQQLLDVLRDPASPATARAAAAKLLRVRVEDRPLIRVVAEQTAQPKMRIALEAAASDDDEAQVDEALAQMVD